MPKPIHTSVKSAKKNDLTVKLLAHYEVNKNYIAEAENFLSTSLDKAANESRKETLTQEDIDRLHSHISALDHMAKLLREEFLIDKNRKLQDG